MDTNNDFMTCPFCGESQHWESYLSEAVCCCPQCGHDWNGTFDNIVINGDYKEVMPRMFDRQAFDMILCDLPYDKTNIDWDKQIDLEYLWYLYEGLIKPDGVIVLTAVQPFTSKLVLSNPEMFKYELIWEKSNATAHMLAEKQPLRAHESILVFYSKQPTYNPQKDVGLPYKWSSQRTDSEHFRNNEKNKPIINNGSRYPRSVQKFKQERGLHPTQKPVPLFEWLIRTYTNKGDLVLDNCAGSGTTGVACIQSGRKYCLIEEKKCYYDTIMKRLKNVKKRII